MRKLIDRLLVLFDFISLPYKASVYLLDNFNENEIFNIETIKDRVVEACGEAIYLKLKNAISVKNIENFELKLEKHGIFAVSINDENYPSSLKNIHNPPLVLYAKGDISLLNKKLIAIVGTRKPTSYGREATRYFASNLSKAGMVTLSGLAYGLDMEVASSTLEAKGKTIAVLGGGLDNIYPSQNTFLAERIVKEGGLLLSLYPPGRRPTKYSFVDRNRIISGLSLGIIVIEAGESSGTLNTASHAIEQGKELFVVPANIFSSASLGSNRLIEEMPETFTLNFEHVLRVLKIENKNKEKQQKNAVTGEQEKLIVLALYEKDLEFDELKEKTNLDSKSLISLLTRLEISGLIKKLPGNIYSLNGSLG